MDRESVERLRFDRRLQRRNGWVDADEVRSNEDALLDVSDKMTTAAELEAEEAKAAEAEEAAAPAAPPAFGTPGPAPVAGDFSGSPSYSTSVGGPGRFGDDSGGTQGA